MSIADTRWQDAGATPTFGAGGSEPYAAALRRNDSNVLYLHPSTSDESSVAAAMDVSRWNADADVVDFTLLRSVTGPVLDIGCGPGRMVRAAMDLGITALGIDVSPTAVEIATDAGLNVILRSVFDALPVEGQWQTVLLVDGNIGIGGDVSVMLERCREILSARGHIVVELHPDRSRDRGYIGRLVDSHGRESEPFPWAEIGIEPFLDRGRAAGLESRQVWELDGRTFCRLAAA